MTRRQAINQVIAVLIEVGGQEEIIEQLRSIYSELPVRKWSEASVRDTFEQFILDHGRAPYMSELRQNKMPNHTVIQHHMGMTYAQLREQYAPGVVVFVGRGLSTPEDELAKFKEEFLRVEPTSCGEYNKKKRPEALTWQRLLRFVSTPTWYGLLDHLGLTPFPPKHEGKNEPRMVFTIDEVGGMKAIRARQKQFDAQIVALYEPVAQSDR